MSNCADPDQSASEANWSRPILFAKAWYIRVQQDQGKKIKLLLRVLAKHTESLNDTKTPILVLLFVLCFKGQLS